MLKIIKDMYNQVKTYVRGCSSYSDFFECAIGLKHGEVISPLLFSLFIEDLVLFLQNDPNFGLTSDDVTYSHALCGRSKLRLVYLDWIDTEAPNVAIEYKFCLICSKRCMKTLCHANMSTSFVLYSNKLFLIP